MELVLILDRGIVRTRRTCDGIMLVSKYINIYHDTKTLLYLFPSEIYSPRVRMPDAGSGLKVDLPGVTESSTDDP